MNLEENFIHEVLDRVPRGAMRAQIEMDLRAHIGERLEHGQSVEDALRQFGDPNELAESYLAAVPLVSAPFTSRATAKLIDFLALVAAICAVLYPAWRMLGTPGAPFAEGMRHTTQPVLVALNWLTLGLGIPGYFVAAEYYTDQTLGKRAVGLRVVRESGARISLGQSMVRQLPFIGGMFVLDILFALFTEKNQRAFELISKTRVVLAEDAAA